MIIAQYYPNNEDDPDDCGKYVTIEADVIDEDDLDDFGEYVTIEAEMLDEDVDPDDARQRKMAFDQFQKKQHRNKKRRVHTR